MNTRIYSWLNMHHYIVNAILIFDLILILLNLFLELLIDFFVFKLSNYKRRSTNSDEAKKTGFQLLILFHITNFVAMLDRNSDGVKRPLIQQIILLISAILTNFISVMVYGDYWEFPQRMLVIISVAQIISLLYFFLSSKTQSTNVYLKSSLIIGVLNILLTFTHIYFFLFFQHYIGFENFVWVGMNSNSMDDWFHCFFYSVSLVIPYSLTELSPSTFLFKFISLFQIGMFYIFIFDKLGDILHNHKG